MPKISRAKRVELAVASSRAALLDAFAVELPPDPAPPEVTEPVQAILDAIGAGCSPSPGPIFEWLRRHHYTYPGCPRMDPASAAAPAYPTLREARSACRADVRAALESLGVEIRREDQAGHAVEQQAALMRYRAQIARLTRAMDDPHLPATMLVALNQEFRALQREILAFAGRDVVPKRTGPSVHVTQNAVAQAGVAVTRLPSEAYSAFGGGADDLGAALLTPAERELQIFLPEPPSAGV